MDVTSKIKPRVTIGIPVYNGDNYLADALDCFLNQSFTDFEIIVSDNCSTDRTEEITRRYLEQDSRIRYVRNEKNLGAAPNYNQCVDLAQADYFKWAAHDDLCEPTYLEKCVQILDEHPDVVIAHAYTTIVDEHGNRMHDYNDLLNLRWDQPHKRFHRYLFRPAFEWNAIFGVMRIEELRKTKLIGDYVASDQTVLGELILRGKIYQIPEPLFYRRDHPDNSWRSSNNDRDLAAWFNPDTLNSIQMPVAWRHFLEYNHSVHRVPMSLGSKMACYVYNGKRGLKECIWPIQKRWRKLSGRSVEHTPVPLSYDIPNESL